MKKHIYTCSQLHPQILCELTWHLLHTLEIIHVNKRQLRNSFYNKVFPDNCTKHIAVVLGNAINYN